VLQKIISGGQTDTDRAALDFAIARGIPHGGWCPRGRLAEDGTIKRQSQEPGAAGFARETLEQWYSNFRL
jgi:hypothetical protein